MDEVLFFKAHAHQMGSHWYVCLIKSSFGAICVLVSTFRPVRGAVGVSVLFPSFHVHAVVQAQ